MNEVVTEGNHKILLSQLAAEYLGKHNVIYYCGESLQDCANYSADPEEEGVCKYWHLTAEYAQDKYHDNIDKAIDGLFTFLLTHCE